ncbi:hypothetical protein VTI74DRAFT_591 [Chaetomium olivicolor]
MRSRSEPEPDRGYSQAWKIFDIWTLDPSSFSVPQIKWGGSHMVPVHRRKSPGHALKQAAEQVPISMCP